MNKSTTKLVTYGLIIVVVLFSTLYIFQSQQAKGNDGNTTQLQPTPSPTPLPTSTGSSPLPTASLPIIVNPTVSIYQGLRIINTDGSLYWVYPPADYQAMSILGYGQSSIYPVPQWSSVSTIEDNVFINPTFSSTLSVNSWSLTYTGVVRIENTAKTSFINLLDTPITVTGSLMVNRQITVALSSTMQSAALQTQITNIISNASGEYYFTIDMYNIQLTLHFANGTTANLAATSNSSNELQWLIKIQ